LLARAGNGPEICAQVVFCPVCDAACDTGSYRRFARGPGLGCRAMRWFWEQYAPEVTARAQVTCSPLRASRAQLAGSPATLLLTAEHDVLRDEGEAFAAKLADAGVAVSAVRYQGVPGDFVMLEALRETAPAREAVRQAGAFLSDAFSSAS
jgi:acetyl esterase